MTINQRTTHFGRRFGDYKFSLRFETFCGEHSRILSQPSLTLGKERSWRMICAISVKRQPKMWFMHYGVWSYDSTWNYNATPHFASFRDLVKHIIDTGNDLNLFTTTVWAIWYCRNFMRTNEQPFPIQQIFQEVQKARASFVRTIPPCPPKQPSQTPPLTYLETSSLVETQG